jgi:hypothetical protein
MVERQALCSGSLILGFAATDFIITITLSAADASAHLIENPFTSHLFHGQSVLITLFLVALLGAVFLKGFKEAIGIAVILVGAYLGLNLIVVIVGLEHIAMQPHLFVDWKSILFSAHGNPVTMIGVSLLLFPKLRKKRLCLRRTQKPNSSICLFSMLPNNLR